MPSYPTRRIPRTSTVDRKPGGSITIIDTEPDFDKFTKDHWDTYNKENLYKENDRLKLYIGILVTIILVGIAIFGDR